jgi:arylsulfatase A-like enzyme
LQRLIQVSFPLLLGVLLILVLALWAGDRIKQSRANAQPLPSLGSPNVLLIVLDTVAAGHLGLYGYNRPTSTTLLELAERGIRFDSARAASSWTLTSHATIFTGRWLHELSVGWLNPLDGTYPTLAEFLGAKGYATAGFVANTVYCASDSGLSRGFAHYQDYIFPELTVFKMAIVIKRVLVGLQSFIELVEDRGELAPARRNLNKLSALFSSDRKGAAMLNRELLHWLAQRTQPERPFFVFLNYADAHTPYQFPPERMHRFGVEPIDSRRRALIEHWGDLDKTRVPARDLAMIVDAYDDCIADLDEQLGMLLDNWCASGFYRKPGSLLPRTMGRALASTPAFSVTV